METPENWNEGALPCESCGQAITLTEACPYCAEQVWLGTQRCPHCNEVLGAELREVEERNWLDKQLLNSSTFILLVLAVCLNGVALIIGVIGLAVCKDPEARRRAMTLVIISGIITAVAVVLQILAALAGSGPYG
jgi:hypothetical protein